MQDDKTPHDTSISSYSSIRSRFLSQNSLIHQRSCWNSSFWKIQIQVHNGNFYGIFWRMHLSHEWYDLWSAFMLLDNLYQSILSWFISNKVIAIVVQKPMSIEIIPDEDSFNTILTDVHVTLLKGIHTVFRCCVGMHRTTLCWQNIIYKRLSSYVYNKKTNYHAGRSKKGAKLLH